MRYSFVLPTLLACIVFLVSCNQKKNKPVKISFNCPKAAGDTIRVGRVNMIDLESIELGKIVLDSAGKGVVEVVVKEPVFAHINNGKGMASGILIAPGDEFQVLPAKPGAKLQLHFEGDGAVINQVYNEAEQLTSAFNKWNGTYSFQLEGEEFLKSKDSLRVSYDQLLSRLKTNPEVPAEKLDLLRRHADMHVIFYQYNFAAGKDSAEIPQSVREVIQKFPVDTIALKAGIFNYGLLGAFFYRDKISNGIYEENDKMDSDTLEAIFPTLVEKKIKASHYPGPVEDFLRVKSANVQIGLNGLTTNLDKVAKTLEKEIASEDYKSVIRKDVARWEKIGPGKSAPDFSGITPDGKKLTLSDLRGKVVYVDIWASWCGPCIDEFPDSKKVQRDFKGIDKVAFLYVSIDRDTLAWKKMVTGTKVPQGTHIIDGTDSPNSISNLYHVWAVPRYLLIDANGRMVATHAARPSSGKVTAELQKLLTSDQFARN